MGRHGLAGIRLSLAFVLAGCTAAAPASVPAPEGAASPEPATHRPTMIGPLEFPAQTPSPPPSAPSPSRVAPPSLDADVLVVRDAALATAQAGTLRFAVEIWSADPADDVPAVTGHGQVSFSGPLQFRYFADEFSGIGGTSPESEVIFDDSRMYTRGRDGVVDSPETWVVLEFDELGFSAIVRERLLEQYSTVLFVIVPAFGVTQAEHAGNQTIRGATATHYVGRSNPDVAVSVLPPAIQEPYRHSLDRLRESLDVRGALGPLPDIDLDVWVDANGKIVRLRYVQDVEFRDIEALLITYDFDAFGAPMALELPEGAEVLTIDELRERYGKTSTPSSPPG